MNVPNRFAPSWDALAKWVYQVADAINNIRAYQAFWKQVSGAIAINENWTFILCDTSGGVCTPTLPTGMPKGWKIIIQDGSLAGTNNITVTRGGTDTINGGTTKVISTNYGRLTLYSDGAGKWYAA